MDFFGGICSNKNTVILYEHYFWVAVEFCVVIRNFFGNYFEQDVPGIAIRNIKNYVAKNFERFLLGQIAAHQSVNECHVGVYHKTEIKKIVQRCFYRRAQT